MALPRDAYERARELLDVAERAAVTRTEEWAGGTAFFNSDFPKKYAQNYLRMEPDVELTPDEIVAEAERVQGAAGLVHRRVNGYGRNLLGLADQMKERGWGANKLIFLGHDGDIRPRPTKVSVENRDLSGIRSALIRWDTSEDNNPQEVAAMLADSRTPYERAGLLTFFAALSDGEVAGFCELWRHGKTAQVENVMTFPEHRNKGVASAVVNEALRVAYKEGSTFCFLIADDDDWPKQLYAKLGFQPFGSFWEFTRTPEG